ncbi:hypothetical protein [Chengkuizengella axinellae]|uniref:Uncharacterized protein n=1 Tax=Chengkuizengella axinellae TaxID=3064388 RepID=A0ABT9J2C2_9BACL|nr:hypothetical protein [Chengkuizengella sp. 2205SS18-9]MDP5275764.1 hypothetical protein [Chengkuizengella sp. 2205SS18-9]
MGAFDQSICDCCVCPMQCVLDQLEKVGDPVTISTIRGGTDIVTITNVEDFILTGELANQDEIYFPICNVSAVEFNPESKIDLKPSVKNTGVCSCCEDPANKFITAFDKNQIVNINFLDGSVSGFVVDVGEGIVVMQGGNGASFFSAISICKINQLFIEV